MQDKAEDKIDSRLSNIPAEKVHSFPSNEAKVFDPTKLYLNEIGFSPLLTAKEELKILTYGSFNSDWGPGPNIEKEFESVCNCNLIWNTAESSGALLSRMKLTKNNEGYDVLLGLDDSLIKEAEGNDLFLEHKIKEFTLENAVLVHIRQKAIKQSQRSYWFVCCKQSNIIQ